MNRFLADSYISSTFQLGDNDKVWTNNASKDGWTDKKIFLADSYILSTFQLRDNEI